MWKNPLDLIYDQQMALADQGGENPYVSNEAIVIQAVPFDFDHYQAAMLADINQLKQLKNIDDKAKAKVEMLKQYMGFVNAYIDNGDKYPNSVAVQCAIWLFDAGNIAEGTRVVLHLIKQGIHHTPPTFDRTLEVFACDAVYDWAAVLYKDGAVAGEQLETVTTTMESDKWSVPPVVEGKMYAMLAKHKMLATDFEAALSLCNKAETANPDGAGVKKLKENIEAALKKA